MKILLTMVVSAVVLTGCAKINVTSEPDHHLCLKATSGGWVGHDTQRRDEMIVRGLIEPDEWDDIQSYTVKIGMSECAALAASYWRAWGTVWNAKGGLDISDEKQLIISAFDPRVLPASAQNYYNQRASQVVIPQGPGRPPITYQTGQPVQAQQLYVPKLLVTIRDGKVSDCKAVDITKVGEGLGKRDLHGRKIDLRIFTLPCTQFVPGFRKY